MVGHILRFDTRCAAIKGSIDRGELGQVVSVYGRRNQSIAMRALFTKSNRLYTTGIHDIDLILWYFGDRKPVEVYMRTRDVGGIGDDLFWGMITTTARSAWWRRPGCCPTRRRGGATSSAR